MPSPFPGMDPYLEGYLWPDAHHRLATQISRVLAPRIRPRYVARLEIAVVSERPSEEEIHIMYPDVEVLRARRRDLPITPLPQTEMALGGVAAPLIMEAPLTVPLIEMRVATVEVRDIAKNELVTSIEIISPANKHEPGLSQHREKVVSLHRAGVHVMEIDLLRRGERTISLSQLQDAAYLVALTRATSDATNIWPIRLRDKLPVVPVPLRKPDPDVPLDLAAAFAEVYDEAAYELSLDYFQAPPLPSLAPADAEWLQALRAQL